jgi:ABC-2 type transport system ATP-binding protein
LGKNGAGKTTTIKMLTQLMRPTSGEFAIMGTREGFGKGIRRVGYLPDVPGFYGYMTGFEFLELSARLGGMTNTERKPHIEGLLKQVGLFGVKTRISGYSRGMRQRLGIAQALVNSPDVVFMDEPISALDPMGRREVMDIIGGLRNAAQKTTVVLSTHILSDVENICDYIVVIEKGQIRVQKNIDELKSLFAKDMLKICFYEEQDVVVFKAALMGKNGSLDVEINPNDPQQLLVRSKVHNPADISKMVSSALSDMGLPFKSFNIHAPTLDDIFYEITREEGEAV